MFGEDVLDFGYLAAPEDVQESVIHVYPNFGREHVLEGFEQGAMCWCHPDIDMFGTGVMVTHNVEH